MRSERSCDGPPCLQLYGTKPQSDRCSHSTAAVNCAAYSLYEKEKMDILASLKRRSEKLVDGLNKLTGVTCNNSDGAMYAFPNLILPEKFVKDCESKGKVADAVYCMGILEETGIVVVPGSGFGQVDGTWHFRTTFLPAEDKIDAVVDRLTKFHENFMKKWM